MPIVEVPCELNFRRALQGFVKGLGVEGLGFRGAWGWGLSFRVEVGFVGGLGVGV